MRATFLILLLIAAALVILVVILRAALVAYNPGPTVEVAIERGSPRDSTGAAPLHLICWNIGYAGLGKESDFLADGGRHLRAPSRSHVERNLAGVIDRLRHEDADLLLIQELARGNYLTYGIDVLGSVRRALPEYEMAFSPTVQVTGLPVVGNLQVGEATLSRHFLSKAVRHSLPSRQAFAGITVQHFSTIETRLPIAGQSRQWALFNVHLAAFDDGALRRQQLQALLKLLEAEYAAGNHVIAGGDWNLLLAPTEFPSTTEEKAKFWVRKFPADLAPKDWPWGVDPAKPTCRTLERPYRAGENYTCVIDGFLVSPNVEVLGVETLDLGFANSDHNPVRLRVRAR